MDRMELTKRQKQVLDFIKQHIENQGIAPSVREICDHFGLKGPAGVHRILKILESKGFLSSSPGKKRSWRLTEKVRGLVPAGGIPVLGQIAAGLPIEAQENRVEELPVDPAGLFGKESCFALYVRGDSMVDAHITDGDIAVIQPADEVNDGEIAAVLVEGILPEATLKIVRRRKGSIELHAANPLYKPMVFHGRDAADVRILGRLAGIIRRTA